MRACALCIPVAALFAAPLLSVAQQIPIQRSTQPSVTLTLRQMLRIGSLNGEHDAFGRIMSVDMLSSGALVVADDMNHRVSVFDSTGEYVGDLGRPGRGPGEFQSPWRIAVDASDTIFIWDAAAARVSVYGPDLEHARDFRVPAHWLINSIVFHDDGDLIVAAYGHGEAAGIHQLSRSGELERTFGPTIVDDPDLGNYGPSLLGGTMTRSATGLVYSQKSPYSITFMTSAGEARRECTGDSDWTTDPASVVMITEQGQGLDWGRYVHSANIMAIEPDLYLNVISDPVNDRRVLDLLTDDCALVKRHILNEPLSLHRARRGIILAVQNVEYPEVIVFRAGVSRN